MRQRNPGTVRQMRGRRSLQHVQIRAMSDGERTHRPLAVDVVPGLTAQRQSAAVRRRTDGS